MGEYRGSKSKQGSQSVRTRFGTVKFRVSCFRDDHISKCLSVSDPETRIQVQRVCSGNGINTGKEGGGSREVR